jgi:hypothetical protein
VNGSAASGSFEQGLFLLLGGGERMRVRSRLGPLIDRVVGHPHDQQSIAVLVRPGRKRD